MFPRHEPHTVRHLFYSNQNYMATNWNERKAVCRAIQSITEHNRDKYSTEKVARNKHAKLLFLLVRNNIAFNYLFSATRYLKPNCCSWMLETSTLLLSPRLRRQKREHYSKAHAIILVPFARKGNVHERHCTRSTLLNRQRHIAKQKDIFSVHIYIYTM